MTETEAFAIIGCNSLDELDDQLELLIFSLKQKILTKSFHPKVFKNISMKLFAIKKLFPQLRKTLTSRKSKLHSIP